MRKDRNHEQKERKVKKRKRGGRIFLAFLVLLMLCAGTIYFLKSEYFSIKNIEVNGNTYYTNSEVRSIAGARLGNNLIFDAEIKQITESLESNPFFKNVSVKRKLPSTLVIEVEERPQVASIEFGDSYIVIDDEGVVLRKTSVDPKVTVLMGLTISKMDVGEPLEVEEKENLSMTLRMLKTMADGDLYFKKIDVSKAVIRAYIYNTLLVKGTAAEVFSSIEAGDVQLVISDLFSRGITRGTIKMVGSGSVKFTPDIEDGE